MKRILPAVLLAVLMFIASAAFAADGGTLDRVGLILYMLGPDDQPLANATVLLQENLDSAEAYEGETDRQGIMMIPSFPLTGFVMAVRDADNALAGLVDVTLYPGTETRIMNNPRSDSDTISLEMLSNTALSDHINGAAPLQIAGGSDRITMYHYEVQVNEAAGGLGALFKRDGNDLLSLVGVSDGAPGAVIPEPTLPPGDDAALPSASSTATTAPTTLTPAPTTSVTATVPSESQTAGVPSASTNPTETSTATETETQGTLTPSAEPAPTPELSPTLSPTAVPTESPTSPSPTASTTTASDLVNVKLFLKNKEGSPLAYYRTTLNGTVEATANGEGEAYYTNVTANVTHELVVSSPEGVQVGTCGLRFVEGTSTSIASVNTGGTYTIDFQRGTQDVYVELVVDPGQVAVGQASSAPSAIAHSSSSGGAAGSASTQAGASEDVIGTPVASAQVTQSGPSLNGYFSDEAGTAIGGATIRLRNEDTKALSSAITTAEGSFSISQLPPGRYSIGALSPEGRNLGEVQFTAARGTKTRLRDSNGVTYLSEAQDSDSVYIDLRELSNGSLDLLYAAKSPMVAPAVAVATKAAAPAVQYSPLVADQLEDTIVETPAQESTNLPLIILIGVLCAAGVITAVVLVTRHARIK